MLQHRKLGRFRIFQLTNTQEIILLSSPLQSRCSGVLMIYMCHHHLPPCTSIIIHHHHQLHCAHNQEQQFVRMRKNCFGYGGATHEFAAHNRSFDVCEWACSWLRNLCCRGVGACLKTQGTSSGVQMVGATPGSGARIWRLFTNVVCSKTHHTCNVALKGVLGPTSKFAVEVPSA